MNDIPLHLLPSVKTPLGTLYLKLSREDAVKRVAALRVKADRASDVHDDLWDSYIAALSADPPQPKLVASLEAKLDRQRNKCASTNEEAFIAQRLLAQYTP
jgi:hypothetical protein